MNKYLAGKALRSLFLRTGFILSFLFLAAIWSDFTPSQIGDYAFSIIVLFTFIITIFCILKNDPLFGYFSFDDKKLIYYRPHRNIEFRFDECEDIGFTRGLMDTRIPCFARGQIARYVYFSKVKVSYDQKLFMGQIREKKKNAYTPTTVKLPLYETEYVLVQYRPKLFSELVKRVPERFREDLLRQEKELVFTRYEKRKHRD